MLSCFLGITLAHYQETNSKLRWGTFGHFAEEILSETGYRLAVDKPIYDRPMVWYFANRGSDPINLLKRSCSELSLDIALDETTKKLFITGPNSSAGLSLAKKIEGNWLKVQEFIRVNSNLKPQELDQKVKDLEVKLTHSPDLQSNFLLSLEKSVATALADPIQRAILISILSTSSQSVSARMVSNPDGQGLVLVPREAVRNLETMFMGSSNEPGSKSINESFKEQFEQAVKEGGKFALSHSLYSTGFCRISLLLESRNVRVELGSFEILEPLWMLSSEQFFENKVADSSFAEAVDSDRTSFWGIPGINDLQTIAISHELNTVSWLDMNSSARTNPASKELIADPTIRIKLTSDGWIVPYRVGNRWPEYYGNWAGIINMSPILKPKMSKEEILGILESLSDEELDGMGKISSCEFPDLVSSIQRHGRLIRASLTESQLKGIDNFDVFVNQLAPAAATDVSRYWHQYGRGNSFHDQLALSRRSLARLRLIENESGEIIRIILAVPIGDIAPAGLPYWVREETSLTITKK